MANISFRLNKGKKITDFDKSYSIYIRITSGRGKDYNCSLGIKVKADDWSTKKERIKNRANLTQRDKHNKILDNITSYLADFSLELKNTSSHEYIIRVKELLNAYFNKANAKNISFFQFVDAFIEKAKTQPNSQTTKIVAKATLKSYRTTLNVLKKYDNYEKKISFNAIDMSFYYSFVRWCEEQDWTPNTIGGHIKIIRMLMRAANELKLTNNEEYKNRKFVKPSTETDEIFLTIEELQLMYELDLSNDEIQEKVRDLFCLGAYTGLRSSDYCSLTSFNILNLEGKTNLKVKMKKTGKTVIIPLNSNAKKIVEKYEQIGFPKVIGHTINQYINVIGEMVGLTEIQQYTSISGGVEKVHHKRKCDRIKSHTARRSFCSNAFLAKVNSYDIMEISGHKTEKSFLKYIKLNTQQRATKIGEHPHFN
jgi:integrase